MMLQGMFVIGWHRRFRIDRCSMLFRCAKFVGAAAARMTNFQWCVLYLLPLTSYFSRFNAGRRLGN